MLIHSGDVFLFTSVEGNLSYFCNMNSDNDKKNLIYCYDAYCGWCYGFLENITGSMRQSIIALALFFLVGGFLLSLAYRKKKKVPAL